MSKVAFLFPGQASQSVGMGHDLYVNYSSARAVFDEVNSSSKSDLSSLMFSGERSTLDQTVNAQPAIAAVSIAAWKALEEASEFIQLPAMVAGHSLGEYSSLAVAGALSIKDTLSLASIRGRLMQKACQELPGGMLAVIGLDYTVVDDICRQSGTQVSNINTPSQIIVSGSKENLVQTIDLANLRGARRVIPLPVSGAFHSTLMGPIQEEFNEFIERIDFDDPLVPIVGNATATPLTTKREVKEELKVQLQSCVRWSDSINYMAKNGVTKFVEIGPGRAISGMVKRLVPDATILNVEDQASIMRYLESSR